MRRQYFIKEGAAPVWIHVPGTPFTLPGERTQYERLPGMTDWAERGMVSRVSKGLEEGTGVEALAEREALQGTGREAGKGAIAGGTVGTMAGRLIGGEAASAPIKELLQKGISKDTLKGFKNVPRAAKIAPVIGALLGAGGNAALWASGRDERRQQAKDVAKGVLSENILRRDALNRAREGIKRLQSGTQETAEQSTPKVITTGSMGV